MGRRLHETEHHKWINYTISDERAGTWQVRSLKTVAYNIPAGVLGGEGPTISIMSISENWGLYN